MSNRHWSRIRSQRLSRRSVLRASARAGVGAAGLALVGCGGDDDDDAQPQAVAQQEQQQEQAQQQVQQQAQQQAQQQEQPEPQQQQTMQEEQQQQAVAQQEQQRQEQQEVQQQQQQQEQVAAEPEPTGPPQGGTLRLGIVYSPANYAAPYSGALAFGPAIWETLTKYGADGLTPEPHLAESWEFNDDQTVLTITLRPGLTFHDGKPLTADEVKKSLERMDDEDVANSQVKSIFNKYVSAVTAIDETTLQLDLAWPGEAIFDALHFANIHDADAIPGLEGYTQVNASGAFKFDTDSYEVDVYARGDRFADSYDPAALDAVEWRTFQDAESMALALQAGELDMVYDLPKSWHSRYAQDPGFQPELAPPTS
ncbi:MAG: ABC transporter substrate-binding protein [Chloroflexi bacterium]|nr:ABC transporter substrate-binding protein [Chloroflexota bacterium]